MPPASPTAVGREAEERACRYLRWRGWRIVARNWVGGGGELDIVASRWKTLVVVEVRLRAKGGGALSVDNDKMGHVMRATHALITAHGLERYRLRYDLIAIDGKGRIDHRKDLLGS